VDVFSLLVVSAVRHVDAHAVDAGREHRFDYSRLARGRTQCGEYLCSSQELSLRLAMEPQLVLKPKKYNP
jgi:hypothetical protein